jgi:diguanylate cyclase (GGDEF)-like protein
MLLLIGTLTVVGLRYAAESNTRLKTIVENHDAKTALGSVMQHALRERALSMHAMAVLTDPFDRDEENQRFIYFGSQYTDAREQLGKLPLTPQERALLDQIRLLTQAAQPEVQAAIDMTLGGHDQGAIFDQIRNNAMPKQREIADRVEMLADLQIEQTRRAIREAETAYARLRAWLLSLGISATLLGLAVSLFVVRHAARQARQLEYQALYDPLTGLPNRALLLDRLEHAIDQSKRAAASFAVAVLDLDRFKEVNDTLGHDMGDQLLKSVAQRLRDTVRAGDTVARLGGDEYVVILHHLSSKDAAAVVAKILEALDHPYQLDGQRIDVAASIGIAFFPEHGQTASLLLRHADIAMYAAKRGGAGYASYSPTQEQGSRDQLSFKGELKEAIEHDQLVLHFQPKIDLTRGCVAGLEALVRWAHPARGFLYPDQFIQLAERGGLTQPLTHCVIRSGLAYLATLHARGHPLTLAVNLSAMCLRDPRLPLELATLLQASGVPPQSLIVEITESAVMSHPDTALVVLESIHAMGVKVSIDDFGTGYSSLAHLKRLPVTELKIDKSFVLDMQHNDNDAMIVKSTIDLGHNLGLKVIAEGVETREAWERLQALGCDAAQGYYMGKPLPPEQLEVWLKESPWGWRE